MDKEHVLVIGCGVAGLSCGIRLLSNGFAVTIIARDLPPNTTSNAAAAIWYPYKAYPEERVLEWGRIALEKYYQLMSIPESGISSITLIELFEKPTPQPWWKDAVRAFRSAFKEELPPGYQDGYVIEAPLIDTHIYMNYLLRQFRLLGGVIKSQTIDSLSELEADHHLIINCAGLGARKIAKDEAVYPIRGQVIQVQAPEVTRSLIEQTGSSALAYIVPRHHDCILGGTAEENNWSLEVNEVTAASILSTCQKLDPALESAKVLQHIVGLRPARKEVRLELENISPRCTVIHNYGHGGAGFTLSWGCAEEVVHLSLDWAVVKTCLEEL